MTTQIWRITIDARGLIGGPDHTSLRLLIGLDSCLWGVCFPHSGSLYVSSQVWLVVINSHLITCFIHRLPVDWRETVFNDVSRVLGCSVRACVCVRKAEDECLRHMCWHDLDAVVESSVISIYLFVQWHIKAPR